MKIGLKEIARDIKHFLQGDVNALDAALKESILRKKNILKIEVTT